MKVVHLLASPFFTGPADAVAQLALAQRALGHDVRVFVDRKRTTTASEELAAPRFAALGLLGERELELSVKSTPWAMVRDAARLRRLEVDVVHTHFSHDHVLARLAKPHAATVRSIHAPRSLRWSTPSADAWTVPQEALTRRVMGAPVMVLPPLVGAEFRPPADRTALRRALGLAEEGPLIGMVSTFQPSRRHALGLAAFSLVRSRVPPARFVLVGDGALEPQLRAQADALGLSDAVTFGGYQSGPRFIEWLQALDEVWVLGLGNDFAGRAAAQAKACAVRVVAVDEGALERCADAVVAPEPQAVADAALGARRDTKLESAESVARRVLALYAQALGSRR